MARTSSDLPGPVAEVVERVAAMSGVEAVVLGGSRVNGTATADSDWDLGIYYRQPLDLEALRVLGEVHPPGSWGRLMNGGAWLTRDGVRIDALLRDLHTVEHWTAEANAGRYEVDGLLGYLAGMPTYTLAAEVAYSVVLTGRLDLPTEYPESLRRSGPDRWRFHRDFSLAHARRAAILGNHVVALGQLARATVEEAHARHCERGSWVLNEKRILAAVGLAEAVSFALPEQPDLPAIVAEVAGTIGASPGTDARAAGRTIDDVLPGAVLAPFTPDDLAELVVLQRCCWVQEAIVNETLEIPPLQESPEQVLAWATSSTTLVVRLGGRLVAAVRGARQDDTWQIGRLMVAPDLAGRGLGSWLLAEIERWAPDDVIRHVLFTGAKSERNVRLYERAGYGLTDPIVPPGPIPGVVFLAKDRR